MYACELLCIVGWQIKSIEKMFANSKISVIVALAFLNIIFMELFV